MTGSRWSSESSDRLVFPAGKLKPLFIPTAPNVPEQIHLFDEREITAINTALAAKRALLIRGEPGTGKTQLASAAALALKRPLVPEVVDSRTQSRDLLWHFDSVRRLAEAQVHGALLAQSAISGGSASSAAPSNADRRRSTALKALDRELHVSRFIHPRALWWGLNWESALLQAKNANGPVPTYADPCDPKNGVVVLIDEIDKGDPDVANGLLQALGSSEFRVPGLAEPIRPDENTHAPLVIVTTNEERALPDAFTRRCVVLPLRLPTDPTLLEAHLCKRGRAHFNKRQIADDVLRSAATLLIRDRTDAQTRRLRPLPGQAEYIDLLRAVLELAGPGAATQKECLDQVKPFLLRKHLSGPGGEGAQDASEPSSTT